MKRKQTKSKNTGKQNKKTDINRKRERRREKNIKKQREK